MLLFIFLAIQFAVAAGGAALLWQRIERQQSEIASLKQALAAKSAGTSRRAAEARAKVVAIGGRAPVMASVENTSAAAAAPPAPAPTRFSLADALSRALPYVTPDTTRGAALGFAAILPALAFPFAANHALVVACGLLIAAGMMALAFD